MNKSAEVEIMTDVADSEHSVILDQLENGVAVLMAVTCLLFSQRMPSRN